LIRDERRVTDLLRERLALAPLVEEPELLTLNVR
jgi:hypothetical protein